MFVDAVKRYKWKSRAIMYTCYVICARSCSDTLQHEERKQGMWEVLTCCEFGQCRYPGSQNDVVSSTNPLNSLCRTTNPVGLLYKRIDNKLPAQICERIACPDFNHNSVIHYEGSQSGEVHKETRLVFFGA